MFSMYLNRAGGRPDQNKSNKSRGFFFIRLLDNNNCYTSRRFDLSLRSFELSLLVNSPVKAVPSAFD